MLKLIVVFASGLLASLAMANGPAPGDETVPVVKSAPDADTAKAADNGADVQPMKLPPGFKPKKRGKFTLYCKKENPIGTRFKQETCFDANQMRDYMIALQENKADMDRMRATCSSICACGQPDAC